MYIYVHQATGDFLHLRCTILLDCVTKDYDLNKNSKFSIAIKAFLRILITFSQVFSWMFNDF